MPTICMESVCMCANEKKVNSWHIDKICCLFIYYKFKIPYLCIRYLIFFSLYVFSVVLYILKDSDDEIHNDKQK